MPLMLRAGRGASLAHLLCAALIASAPHAAAFVTDLDVYDVPPIPRPEYLVPIVDPVFGTTVVRVSDAGQPIQNPTGDPSLVGLVWGLESGHGYSSRASWNADQSLLMMEPGVSGNVFLDGATYQPLFRRSVPGDERWHPTDPDRMLFIDSSNSKNRKKPSRHCVGAYEPGPDAIAWERCFDGFDKITWSDPGKGKPSIDGRFIPIRARRSSDGHWIATVYDIHDDSLSTPVDMTSLVDSKSRPDFTMSPLGDVMVVVGAVDGVSKAQVAFDVATGQELWRVLEHSSPGHADDVVDQYGEQWRVGGASTGEFAGSVIKRNFRTGEGVALLPYRGSHVSGRNLFDPVYKVVVSYHEPASSPLHREIVGVCLDGSCFERYAHTHRSADSRYLNESHGSVSASGDRIVFRSSWDVFGGPIDAYVIELDGASPGPIPDPVTAPVATVTAPADGSSYDEGGSVTFVGAASDAEEGDLSGSLDWASNLDGSIGSGASFSISTLAVGVHRITASVTDGDGLSDSDQISVTVMSETIPTGLEARPYKVKGVQHVDLSWNGGIGNLDIERDGAIVATTPNDGSYTESLGKKGGGAYVYRACAEGTQSCSNPAVAGF